MGLIGKRMPCGPSRRRSAWHYPSMLTTLEGRPLAPERHFPVRLIHRYNVYPLHRKEDTLCTWEGQSICPDVGDAVGGGAHRLECRFQLVRPASELVRS